MDVDPVEEPLQPEYAAEWNRFSRKSVRQARNGVGVSAVLLGIAIMTIYGLRAENTDLVERRAYLIIVGLFSLRFIYSFWRLWSTWRSVRSFQIGVERQLAVSRVGERTPGEVRKPKSNAA